MALRSSSVSKSSILNKFNSSSSSALAAMQAIEDYAYQQGQTLPADQLAILEKRLKTTATGTTARLTVQKKIDSVKNDISIGAMEDKIRAGSADPMDIIPLLEEKVSVNGIQQGTPAYNDLVIKATTANDDSIKRKITKAKQKWTIDSENDRVKADNDYINTVAPLIENIDNDFTRSSLVNDLTSFSQEATKRFVDDQISTMRRGFRESGADQTAEGKRAYAQGLYEYSQQLRDAGLNEKADQVYDQYLSANESYKSSLKGSGSKTLNSEISRIKDELDAIPITNTEAYKEKYQQLVDAKIALAQHYNAVDDSEKLRNSLDDLSKMGVDSNGKFDPNLIDEMNRSGLSENVAPEVKRRMYSENLYTGGDTPPRRGQYVAVMEDGVLKFKMITNAPRVGDDGQGNDAYRIEFDGSLVTFKGGRGPQDDLNEMEGYIQDEDGIMYKIYETPDETTGKRLFYINNKNANGENKNVGFDQNGVANILPENTFTTTKDGKMVYREQSDDGGYNFSIYNPTDGSYSSVNAEQVSKDTGMAINKVLEGSKNQNDINTMAGPLIDRFKDQKITSKDQYSADQFRNEIDSMGNTNIFGMGPENNIIGGQNRNNNLTIKTTEENKAQTTRLAAAKPVVDQLIQQQVAPAPAPAPRVQPAPVSKEKAVVNVASDVLGTVSKVAAASPSNFGYSDKIEYKVFGQSPVIKTRSEDKGWNFTWNGKPIDITTAAKMTGLGEKELVIGSQSAYDKSKYKI